MKICIFAIKTAHIKGFEKVVSAHVQVPIFTIDLLKKNGNDIEFITPKPYEGYTFPVWLNNDVPIHYVIDSSNQKGDSPIHVGHKIGVNYIKLLIQIIQIIKIIKVQKYNVVHCFGTDNMALVAGIIKIFCPKIKLITTCESGIFNEKLGLIKRYLINCNDHILTCTSTLQNKMIRSGIKYVHKISHGVIRDFYSEDNEGRSNKRVLFWRDPSYENGADTCLEVYKRLAPLYPNISFDLAIRPFPKPVHNLKNIDKIYKNINVYTFPYKNNICIETLIAESVCILLPFRKLSVNPQFSVIESMLARKVVITTAIESNIELIDDTENGFLVDVDEINVICKIIESVILNKIDVKNISINARSTIINNWNWDHYKKELLHLYKSNNETNT